MWSADECKRKWKNMRDRYLKEVRMEIKSKKQGEIVPSKWKYRQLMDFIAPFAGTRSCVADICGNDDHDNPDESGSTEGENGPSELVKTPQPLSKVAVSQPDLKPHVAFVPQLPSLSQDVQIGPQSGSAKLQSGASFTPGSKTGRKRQLAPDEPPSLPAAQSLQSPSKWPKDNGGALPNRPRDEDELFMLSFVPALKRLAPQKRCETKIKIQQIMYEAEFNVSRPEKRADSQRD
ncbi:uncharacterized protein LOC130516940 isoform X2 [Takifugu flavidus]|uniref:uncharacterized protein LOC130516940 isoform X2 n=1 Tax=Takifugu flavidus TaxID=433684 RepID=UPI0025442ACF|nr:uncharacterized protein LOC130516940 isoform X2 [Takifugu flavidus]